MPSLKEVSIFILTLKLWLPNLNFKKVSSAADESGITIAENWLLSCFQAVIQSEFGLPPG